RHRHQDDPLPRRQGASRGADAAGGERSARPRAAHHAQRAAGRHRGRVSRGRRAARGRHQDGREAIAALARREADAVRSSATSTMRERSSVMGTSAEPHTGPGGGAFDEARAEAFVGRVLGDTGGANAVLLATIGDRLGLFKTLPGHGPATSGEFAQRAGIDERYGREWLSGMTAAGYLHYDASGG